MTALSLIANFHEHSSLNELARTHIGKLIIWVIGTALLTYHHVSPLAAVAIGLVFIAPAFRRIILSVATIAVIFEYYVDRQALALSFSFVAPEHAMAWAKVGVFFTLITVGFYVLFQLAKRLPNAPGLVRRHPVLLLHCVVISAFGLMLVFPPLAAMAELVPWLIWRISYLLQFGQRGGAKSTGFTDHLFYLWPIYEGSGLPYGKGLDYLSRHEARDEEADASSRLAGIKVLALATLWDGTLYLFEGFFYHEFAADALFGINIGLPTMQQAIAQGDNSVGVAWLTVILGLFHIVLRYAVIGHIIVGLLRLAGFNIFRNTYKPLLSESIVDFWSRFNYYFKELMVEFFFYPTFLRFPRLHARLRLFLAVLAAAFVGNMYYHIFFSQRSLAAGDYLIIWDTWSPRMVYCVLLAIGIWISMLRQQEARKVRATKTTLQKFRAIAGVWLFYSVVHVWNLTGDDLTWSKRIDFSISLLGL